MSAGRADRDVSEGGAYQNVTQVEVTARGEEGLVGEGGAKSVTGLQNVPVFKKDVADGDVVGMVSQDRYRSVSVGDGKVMVGRLE